MVATRRVGREEFARAAVPISMCLVDCQKPRFETATHP